MVESGTRSPADKRHGRSGNNTQTRATSGPLGWFEARLYRERARWFLWLPVCFGLGIAIYFALQFEPSMVFCLGLLVLCMLLQRLWREGVLGLIVPAVLLSTIAGVSAAKVRTLWVAAPALQQTVRKASLTGRLVQVEPRASGGHRLTVRVATLAHLRREQLPNYVRFITRRTDIGLHPGQHLQVSVTLLPPARPAIPGGYDFARAAYYKQIGGFGYAHGAVRLLPTTGTVGLSTLLWERLRMLRQNIRERVNQHLSGQTAAVATALITGERGGLSPQTLHAYRDAGLSHILAISGLHMSIMAGFVYLLMRHALAISATLALHWPIRKIAAICALFAAVAYLLISGASYATLRSWIMMSVMFIAILCDRPAITMRNVALAGMIILIAVPESLMNVGFQMSFAAVTALVASYEAFRDRRRYEGGSHNRAMYTVFGIMIFSIIASTIIASLAVLPFSAFHFHKSQQYAVLANLVAVPICNVIVMPMALLALLAMPFGLEAVPLQAMGFGITWITACASRVADLPGAVIHIRTISALGFALLVLGSVWLCLWRTRLRLAGLALIILGLVAAPIRSYPNILVGEHARVVAIRGTDGLLSAAGSRRGGRFQLTRWLAHDGDPRHPSVVLRRPAFRCDDLACRVNLSGLKLEKITHPVAFRTACQHADIIVAPMHGPTNCGGARLIIDAAALTQLGVHAIYRSGMTLRIETVEGRRGRRPWSRLHKQQNRQ